MPLQIWHDLCRFIHFLCLPLEHLLCQFVWLCIFLVLFQCECLLKLCTICITLFHFCAFLVFFQCQCLFQQGSICVILSILFFAFLVLFCTNGFSYRAPLVSICLIAFLVLWQYLFIQGSTFRVPKPFHTRHHLRQFVGLCTFLVLFQCQCTHGTIYVNLIIVLALKFLSVPILFHNGHKFLLCLYFSSTNGFFIWGTICINLFIFVLSSYFSSANAHMASFMSIWLLCYPSSFSQCQ